MSLLFSMDVVLFFENLMWIEKYEREYYNFVLFFFNINWKIFDFTDLNIKCNYFHKNDFMI